MQECIANLIANNYAVFVIKPKSRIQSYLVKALPFTLITYVIGSLTTYFLYLLTSFLILGRHDISTISHSRIIL